MRTIKTITSKDNPMVKLIEQLDRRKYRDKLGLYLIEGPNLLAEALQERADIEAVLVTGPAIEDPQIEGLLLDNEALLEGKLYGLPTPLFSRVAQTETTQGVLAVVRKPDEALARERLLAAGTERNLLILDRLQDPGNLGTILRTADGAGFGGVVAVKGTADLFAPKVVRAAAGSLFRVPVVFTEDAQESVALVKAAGGKLIVTSLTAGRYYYQEDLRHHAAIVIGNEGRGVSAEFLKAADVQVKIPMEGPIDSLNAAVAAAILMYERLRDRN